MKTLLTSVAILIGIIGATAQNEEIRTLSEFSAIKTSGNIKVVLINGEPQSVKVKAENSGELKKITTEVKNNVLEIGGNADDDAKVFITVKTLNQIESGGASTVKSDGNFNTNNISLIVGGAASIKLQITAGEITANVSGSGLISLTGTASKLTADISGAASLKALNLITETVVLSTTGASSAKVSAVNFLSVNASGASNVTYRDGTKDVVVEKSGSSTVKKSESDDVVTGKNGDTTKIKFGDKRFIIIDDEDKKKKHNNDDDDDFVHWAGIDLGVNGFLTSKNKLQMPNGYNFLDLNYARSLNFNLNFFEHGFKIYKHHVQLVTGLGFEFDHYSFKNPITLYSDSNHVGAYWDSTMTFEKNKLNTSFITLPLMLEFNTNNKNSDKSFHISGGIVLAYNMSAKTKQEYVINGYEFDVKKKDDFNINPFRYSATVRAGFGDFNLFATYALNTLFETNKSPNLYPFTVGLTLCNF